MVMLVAASCGGDSSERAVTPTEPAASSTPLTSITPGNVLPSPVTVATSTPIGPISVGDVCPIRDEGLCNAAIELRAAARSNDQGFFADRLTPSTSYCGDTPQIGCPPEVVGPPPIPSVAWFNYASDCCYVTARDFRDELAAFLSRAEPALSDTSASGGWNVFGIVRQASFWPSKTAVILTAMFDDGNRWVIEIGVDLAGERLQVLGAIKEAVGRYYQFPESELRRW